MPTNCHLGSLRKDADLGTSAGPPAEVDAVAGGGIEEASKGTNEELEPSAKGLGSDSF